MSPMEPERRQWVYSYIVMAVIIIASPACVTSGASGPKRLQAVEKKEQGIRSDQSVATLSVADLLKESASLAGKKITVRGIFRGWQGPCKYPPPETRSDWMLADDGSCIYVSGPVPRSLDSKRSSPDIGKKIEVRGYVRLDKKGRPYLKADAERENPRVK